MYHGLDIDMIPNQSLSNPTPIWSPYIPPDDELTVITATKDVELGGIGIQDPSQGLEVQTWTLQIIPNGLNGDFYLSAPNTPPTYLFSRTNATWCRLAFDQNMFPFISYIDINGAGYYWYDPIAHSFAFVTMASDVTYPCCTLDDKRPLATVVGSSDIILTYIRGINLYYRQQRDRYGTEYLLQSNVNLVLPNPSVWSVGMNEGMRLQFLYHGNLYT